VLKVVTILVTICPAYKATTKKNSFKFFQEEKKIQLFFPLSFSQEFFSPQLLSPQVLAHVEAET